MKTHIDVTKSLADIAEFYVYISFLGAFLLFILAGISVGCLNQSLYSDTCYEYGTTWGKEWNYTYLILIVFVIIQGFVISTLFKSVREIILYFQELVGINDEIRKKLNNISSADKLNDKTDAFIDLPEL